MKKTKNKVSLGILKKKNNERRYIGTPNDILPESSCSRKMKKTRKMARFFNFYGP